MASAAQYNHAAKPACFGSQASRTTAQKAATRLQESKPQAATAVAGPGWQLTQADKGDEQAAGLKEQAVRLKLGLHAAVDDGDDAVDVCCGRGGNTGRRVMACKRGVGDTQGRCVSACLPA